MGLVPFSHCMCVFLDPELLLAFPQHDVRYCSPALHLPDDISCLFDSRDQVLVHNASHVEDKEDNGALICYRHVSGGQEGSESLRSTSHLWMSSVHLPASESHFQ